MNITQMFKNRNKTWNRLEELGFDLNGCVSIGDYVVFNNISILWLEHADHFSVMVRCPECLELFGQIYSSIEILNGFLFPSNHKCNQFNFLRRLANLINDAISDI